MESDTLQHLFTNEQNRQQDTQELLIRAPADLDLAALEEKLDAIDGVEVELRGAGGGQQQPEARQQALQQQAETSKGMVASLVDQMTWGREQDPAAEAALQQLQQGSPDRGD